MSEAMKEATHALLQTGDHMCSYDAVHPPPVQDMTNAYDSNARAFRSDCKGGTISNNNVRQGAGPISSPLCHQKRALQMKKQKHPWYVHQSNAHTELKPCQFKGCPGRKRAGNKTKNRPYMTCMRCEECVVLNEGKHMHFCNVTKKGDVRNCHSKYHQIIYPNPNNKRNTLSSP